MSRVHCQCVLLLSTLILISGASAQEPAGSDMKSRAVTSEPPEGISSQVAERDFGYVIGDLLIQRIELPQNTATPDISGLIEPSRISTWLERQSAKLQTLDSGIRELNIRYQIVNAPQTIVHAALPELQLVTGPQDADDPGADGSLHIAAWPFTLGPLTAATAAPASEAATSTIAPGLPSMRSDHSLPPLDHQAPAQRLRLSLWLLGATLLGWATWFLWRSHHDTVRLPFAQALHQLHQQSRKQPSKAEDPESPWQILHHAFNQTSGHVISSANLSTLYEAQPWLLPLEPNIRAFFDASAARHFEIPAREEPFAVTELGKKLAERERSNSR